MRTTVNVDDHLLAAARDRARQRGQTLGEVVSDALRRELSAPPQREVPEVPVYHGEGGFRAGVDPTSNRSLREALDAGVPLTDQR